MIKCKKTYIFEIIENDFIFLTSNHHNYQLAENYTVLFIKTIKNRNEKMKFFSKKTKIGSFWLEKVSFKC